MKRAIAAIVLVCIPIMGAASDCDSKRKEPAAPKYAGDGVTQFTDSGRLRFGTTYAARYVDTTDRTNCRWSIYTLNADGDTRVVKSGNYLTAKIKVARPSRVKVFLRSSECGNWTPR